MMKMVLLSGLKIISNNKQQKGQLYVSRDKVNKNLEG